MSDEFSFVRLFNDKMMCFFNDKQIIIDLGTP